MMNTINFVILENLKPCYGPIEITSSYDDIKNELYNLIDVFKKIPDKSGYFDTDFFNNAETYISHIEYSLKQHNYFVRNGYNKYYVIAFALNYTRFEVFSKGHNKQLIKWRNDDVNDSIVGFMIYDDCTSQTFYDDIKNHLNEFGGVC